jgi:general stress protein 26
MDKASREFILEILDTANDLTLATNRPDGWPQATTASFVHDGLRLYIVVGRDGQKAKNIARDRRVSVVVDVPYRDWSEIRGLSMGAEAELITDAEEIGRIGALMMVRFGAQVSDLASVNSSDIAFVRIQPKVISILDYTKGFGHTELVEVTAADLH